MQFENLVNYDISQAVPPWTRCTLHFENLVNYDISQAAESDGRT